jgi:phage recombination protein Bet
MNGMIFQIIDGEPVPRLPRAADGAPRVPDGATYFTLEQAAERSGRSREHLRVLWQSTFEELFPGASELFAPAAVQPPGRAAELAYLRRTMFPELADDEMFEAFLFLCGSRGLNPWCGQVRPKILVNDDGSRRVELMLCIEGFRLIAHRTGVYAGCDDTEFTYEEHHKIERAITTVYKLVGNHRCAFAASARWAEYAGIPAEDDIRRFRDQMPHVWLGKCSEAAALRKAFSQELSGIYTPEEMAAVDSRVRGGEIPRADRDEADQRTIDDECQLPEWERSARSAVGASR